LADVMDAILSLDDSISNKIFNHMETLDKKGGASEAEGEITPVEEIMAEIHNLNDHITATKQEIAALKTDSESNTPIATATEELAEAANAILENAELIDGVVAELRGKIPQGDPDDLGPNVDKLEFIGMELMTACSFQDLTGQRINKVVNSLNYIEERLQKMIEIWNIEHGTADLKQMTFAKDDDRKDRDLLSGPQAKEDAMGQDDIDAMFD